MLFRPSWFRAAGPGRLAAQLFILTVLVSPQSAGGPHSGAWRYNRRETINRWLTVHRHFANDLICLSRSRHGTGRNHIVAVSGNQRHDRRSGLSRRSSGPDNPARIQAWPRRPSIAPINPAASSIDNWPPTWSRQTALAMASRSDSPADLTAPSARL